MSTSDAPPAKRVKLTKQDLEDSSKDELIEKWLEQEQYVDILEIRNSEGQKDSLELMNLRESEDKLRQQQLEASRRENLLVMRLAAKEQEMQEYANQIQELKQAQTPGSTQLRSTLLDPAVNLMFERMKKELIATKAKLEETQNELSAWKFTPDSNTGKRLMAKCRLLYQENEELGKMISSGRMAKLEGDLALQKNFSEEMKKSQAELDEFLLELDEDVEGMQSTILYLQQQLRESKDQVARLQVENQQLQATKNIAAAAAIPSIPQVYDLSKSVAVHKDTTESSVADQNESKITTCIKSEVPDNLISHIVEKHASALDQPITQGENPTIVRTSPTCLESKSPIDKNVVNLAIGKQIASDVEIMGDWLTVDKIESLESKDQCELSTISNGSNADVLSLTNSDT